MIIRLHCIKNFKVDEWYDKKYMIFIIFHVNFWNFLYYVSNRIYFNSYHFSDIIHSQGKGQKGLSATLFEYSWEKGKKVWVLRNTLWLEAFPAFIRKNVKNYLNWISGTIIFNKFKYVWPNSKPKNKNIAFEF